MFEKINYEFEEISESLDFEYQDELVAVITAAIAASLKRSTHSLVVRSIKHIPTVSPAWNRAARLNLTTSWL
jgi:hypothetical protein